MGLKKVFPKYPFGIKSNKDNWAVKGIYIEIDDKELLTILGHNGAGKSTLIGVLTGILASTEGTAKFKNLDINEDIEEIR